MRLFIAVLPDENLHSELIRLQKKMQNGGIIGNYTDASNLHLTLAYIGEYPDTETVMEAIEAVDFEPFDITLEGYGSFKKIWWCGIRESKELNACAAQLRRALSERNIPYDTKAFFPHITLLRKADVPLPALDVQPLPMTVSRISLMWSHRTEKGLQYTELDAVEITEDEKRQPE